MKFKFGLLILTLLLFQYTKLNGLNLIVNFKEDSIHLDQSSINYIYNRALDIVIRHDKISNKSGNRLLFNPSRDTIFVSPELNNSFGISPNFEDSINYVYKANIQPLFSKTIFYNTVIIKKKTYDLNFKDVNNSNISIVFSDIYLFKNKFFLSANIFSNDIDKEIPGQGSSTIILEIEKCKNDFMVFKKLFSNVEYQISPPYIPLDSQNSNERIDSKEIILSDGLHIFKKNKNSFPTSFYQFELGDKNCNE